MDEDTAFNDIHLRPDIPDFNPNNMICWNDVSATYLQRSSCKTRLFDMLEGWVTTLYSYNSSKLGRPLLAKIQYIIWPRYRRAKRGQILGENEVGKHYPDAFVLRDESRNEFEPIVPESTREIVFVKICDEYMSRTESDTLCGVKLNQLRFTESPEELPVYFDNYSIYIFPHTCINGVDPGSIEIWVKEKFLFAGEKYQQVDLKKLQRLGKGVDVYTLYSFLPKHNLVKKIWCVDVGWGGERVDRCQQNVYERIPLDKDEDGYISTLAVVYTRTLEIFREKYNQD